MTLNPFVTSLRKGSSRRRSVGQLVPPFHVSKRLSADLVFLCGCVCTREDLQLHEKTLSDSVAIDDWSFPPSPHNARRWTRKRKLPFRPSIWGKREINWFCSRILHAQVTQDRLPSPGIKRHAFQRFFFFVPHLYSQTPFITSPFDNYSPPPTQCLPPPFKSKPDRSVVAPT
jgi:hypothetical protein